MRQKAIRLGLFASAAIFGLAVANGANAADVGKVAEECAGCHGKDGASTESDMRPATISNATFAFEVGIHKWRRS